MAAVPMQVRKPKLGQIKEPKFREIPGELPPKWMIDDLTANPRAKRTDHRDCGGRGNLRRNASGIPGGVKSVEERVNQ